MISQNEIVKSEKYWKNPVRILNHRKIGTYLELKVQDIVTGEIFPVEFVQEIYISPFELKIHRENLQWALEAWRLTTSFTEVDAIVTISANIKLEPYQLEAVYGFLLPSLFQYGSIRYLIADDPGAGKTIITLMVLGELIAREKIKRIMISVPPALQSKWLIELKQKFGFEGFENINGMKFKSDIQNLNNPWDAHDKIVVSSFLGINKIYFDLLNKSNKMWDLIIVDEAHRFGNPDAEVYFNYLSILSDKCNHLLFLTATPHTGKKEQFAAFINLLKPAIIYDEEISEISTPSLPNVMIRRGKEDLMDSFGNPVFKLRDVKTRSIESTTDEKNIYELLNQYLEKDYQISKNSINYDLNSKKPNLPMGFIRSIYRKRFASSLFAVKKTLQKRLDFLENVGLIPEQEVSMADSDEIDFTEESEFDTYSKEEQNELFTLGKYKKLSDIELREVIDNEKNTIKGILGQIHNFPLTKSAKWLDLMDFLIKNADFHGNPAVAQSKGSKLIIFSEFKDTADWLTSQLRNIGWLVTQIDGDLPMGIPEDIDDMKKIPPFKNQNAPNRLIAMKWFEMSATILVATDAAGEGIDLQFCHYMINFDIPWNPNRLNQRMGRIHRYGQLNDVLILNFCNTSTIEDNVFQLIQKKLEDIRNDYHRVNERFGKTVYDVLAEMITEKDYQSLVQRIHENKDPANQEMIIQEYAKKMDPKVRENLDNYLKLAQFGPIKSALQQNFGEKKIDLYRKIRKKAPEYLEHFFIAAWGIIGGNTPEIYENGILDGSSDDNYSKIWRLKWDPINEIPEWLKKHGINTLNDELLVNFSKKIPDIINLNHKSPLFEDVSRQLRLQYETLLKAGDFAMDPKAETPYVLYFFKYALQDGNNMIIEEDVIGISHNYTSPNEWKICYDARTHFNLYLISDEDSRRLEKYKHKWIKLHDVESYMIPDFIFEKINSIKNKKQPEIEKENKIRLKNINREDSELASKIRYDPDKNRRILRQAQMEHKKKKVVEFIENQKKSLQIRPKEIRFLTAFVVLPCEPGQDNEIYKLIPNVEKMLERNNNEVPIEVEDSLNQGEIERIALNHVIEFEKRNGRIPLNKRTENGLGYDIESQDQFGNIIRTIEVKGKKITGPITLEAHELQHLKRNPDVAWVYVVTDCDSSQPQIHCIDHFLDKINPDEYISNPRLHYHVAQQLWKGAIGVKNE